MRTIFVRLVLLGLLILGCDADKITVELPENVDSEVSDDASVSMDAGPSVDLGGATDAVTPDSAVVDDAQRPDAEADADTDADTDAGIDEVDAADEDTGIAMSVCGNGVVEADEGCDDGNTDPSDGCDADCAVEDGFLCEGEPSVCRGENECLEATNPCASDATCMYSTC